MTDVKRTANCRNTIDAEDRRQRADDSSSTPILDARETGDSIAIADVAMPIPTLPIQLPKIGKEAPRCSGLFRLSMRSASAPRLEQLLRIDPASGKKPVLQIKKKNISFVDNDRYPLTMRLSDGTILGKYFDRKSVSTTFYRIVDQNGIVLGHFTKHGISNQAGEWIAQKMGRQIVRGGHIIGYFRGKGVYDTQGKLVGLSNDTERYAGMVLKGGRITAEVTENKRLSVKASYDSVLRLMQLVRGKGVLLKGVLLKVRLSVRLSALNQLAIMKAKDIKVLEKELDTYPPSLRGKLLVSLCKVFPKRRMHFAHIAMSDKNELVRRTFVSSLRKSPWTNNIDQAEDIALRALERYTLNVKEEALLVLKEIGLHRTHAFFGRLLVMFKAVQVFPQSTRAEIVSKYGQLIPILGHIPGQKSLDLLNAFLEIPNKKVQDACLEAISHMSGRVSRTLVFPLALRYFSNNVNKKKLSRNERSLLDQLDITKLSDIIKFEDQQDCYHQYIPQLRKLLSHKCWHVRDFAATIMMRIGVPILVELCRLDRSLVDERLLFNIGARIYSGNHKQQVKAIIQQIRTMGPKDSRSLTMATHILAAALGPVGSNVWTVKEAFIAPIASLYIENLKKSGFSLSAKRSSIFLLITLIKQGRLPRAIKGNIVYALLTLRGPLGTFALRNLAAIRDNLTGFFGARLITVITDRLNSKLIRKSPPYDEWFNWKRNPDKVITAKIYFQMEQKDWEAFMEKDHFVLKSRTGKTTLYEKTVNGVKLRTLLVDISGEKGKIRTDIFKDIADPKIHYLGYNGHAGMGGNLEMKKKPTVKDPSAYGTKIIHIGACNSIRSYYARAMKMAPGSHFIGIDDVSYTDDEVKTFLATMNGIAYRKSWKQIGDDIKAKAPFVYHYQDKRPRSFFAHVLPHDLRQFKYAVLNPLDRGGIESLSFAAPREDIREINVAYGGRLRQAVHNLNDTLSYHRTFFENAEMITGNEIYDGTFFTNTTDDQTPLKITKVRNGTRPTYRIEVNAGFAHISESALSVLLMYEVNAHFSKEKHGKLTKEDKLRGLLMAAERIYYSYRGRHAVAEEMFGLLKDRYSIPQNISFDEVYALQKAIDDTMPQVPSLKKALLAKIN